VETSFPVRSLGKRVALATVQKLGREDKIRDVTPDMSSNSESDE
jgi:hypothetical protein